MPFDKGLSLTVLRLFCSLCLQSKYNRLEESLPLFDGSTFPTRWRGSGRRWRQSRGTRASAADQDENMAPVDDVDNATEEFGFAP